MSNTREYVGCKSIEIENYDGNGNNLYNMWIADEEIVRCRDCVQFSQDGICGFHSPNEYDFMPEPDGFCKWGERR